MSDTALVVMARYPEVGKTKTRLARTIGHDETNPVTLTLISTFWMDLYTAAHKSLEAMIV